MAIGHPYLLVFISRGSLISRSLDPPYPTSINSGIKDRFVNVTPNLFPIMTQLINKLQMRSYVV